MDLSETQLGEFRLLRRLGKGAMAEVYLAEQCKLKRQVAIKVLKRELADDKTYVERFRREAQAAASLIHANIVQIHEVGRAGDIHFIVQEYVQGVNLRQWIAKHGKADLKMGLLVMRQVASALAKAADHGIVHRDVKPENILISHSGEVKVADFGLACFPGSHEGVDLTQIGMTLGTPLYMSPEQAEGRLLDPRSDIYSFGVTCYHLLSGSPPFAGETALALAVQHLKKTPEPLENLRPDLPPALCRMVHKMLAKSAAERQQLARDLLNELHQIHHNHVDHNSADSLTAWESSDLDITRVSRNTTTEHLQHLMETAALSRADHFRWARWLGGCLSAVLIGALLALLISHDPPLLRRADAEFEPIPRQSRVSSQYLYAKELGTEAAWESVSTHFPDQTDWIHRAQKQLALIYLYDGRDKEAMAAFEELASLDETERQLKAFGLAGRYWLLTKTGKSHESALVLAELWPIRSDLHDPVMRRLIRETLHQNHSNLGSLTTQEWEEWLETQSQLTEGG